MKKGNMKFQELAQAFNEIEPVSSRNEMTRLLSELFSKANPNEAKIIAYLSLGTLNPPYKGTFLNFADKNVIKVLARLLEISESEVKEIFKKTGDLGLVAEQGNWNKSSNLTVEQVYDELIKIEKITGLGSQEIKLDMVYNLMKELDPISAKYISKILTDRLRLGFSDMTIIDALSWMLVGSKLLHDEIENAYNHCVDIGLIAYTSKKEGEAGIKEIKIEIGIPIRPAAAERLNTAEEIIKKVGDCVAQPKLDGFRLQIHIDKTKTEPFIRFFSRNLNDMSQMFPDLVKELIKLDVETIIFEGEAIAYDINTGSFVPFQETVKRKRKHGIEELSQELPLKFFIFDLLYLNGEEILQKIHEQRRAILLKLFEDFSNETIQVIEEKKITDAKQLEQYFMQNIESGLEGLVVKKPDSIYQPGKRNFNWIKLKRHEEGELSDTIDCVVLGYYAGEGKRAKFGIGAFLVGLFNKDKDNYQTVAKIGTGLKDDEWIELKKKCDAIKIDIEPKNIECDKNLFPDVWVFPEIVVTVFADEITQSPAHTAGKTDKNLGFALRFPRFMGYRPDKSAEESTSIEELKEMYKLQFKK